MICKRQFYIVAWVLTIKRNFVGLGNMKTVNNHAFWREILDQLPSLILVFHVDEDESVQLIFANSEIENVLGYKPQEYVLASESPGRVKQEVDHLINLIADLSHNKAKPGKMEYSLSSQTGLPVGFLFDYKLFQTRSNRSNLIVASFDSNTDYSSKPNQTIGSEPGNQQSSVFVADSDIMKVLLDKLSEFVRTSTNVLIRGEQGTGKRTIAGMLAKMMENSPDQIHYLDFSKTKLEEQKSVLFGSNHGHSNGILALNRDVILVLNEIPLMTLDVQRQLTKTLRNRSGKQLQTRIIATARVAIEDLIEKDKFDAGLYYALGFQPLLVPPLRHRKSEIPVIAREWLHRIAATTGLEIGNIPDREFEKLKAIEWKGNLSELFDVLRTSLLAYKKGEFRVQLGSRGIESDNTTGKSVIISGQEDIVPFEEMNRRYLSRVLEATNGKIYGEGGAAELLKLKPTTLQSKLKKLNIK